MLRVFVATCLAAGCIGSSELPKDPNADDGMPETLQVDCEAIYQRQGDSQTFYEDNPTYIDEGAGPDWRLGTPPDHGIDEATLETLAAQLAEQPNLLSQLVVRGDELIFERYYHGSAADHSNNIHSSSKSILSTVFGIALADGVIDSIDSPLSAYLPDYVSTSSPNAAITLRHVVTMSGGLEWTEDDTEYSIIEPSSDWIAAILAQPIVDAPGSQFNYSSGMSHVLSAVLTEASGKSTCELAHELLLGPLGITAEHWGRDPTGVFSGGYNLYMTPRELARFGLLFLDGGTVDGRTIVPSSWVQDAIAPKLDTREGYDYGYYWWLTTLGGRDVAIAWGFGGQYIYLIPELDAMVVMTSDTAQDYDELEGELFVAGLIAAIRD